MATLLKKTTDYTEATTVDDGDYVLLSKYQSGAYVTRKLNLITRIITAITGVFAKLDTANTFTETQNFSIGSGYLHRLVPGTDIFQIQNLPDSGVSVIDLDPIPQDGTSNASVRFFRSTNTTGVMNFQVFAGDGTPSQAHSMKGDGSMLLNSVGLNGGAVIGGIYGNAVTGRNVYITSGSVLGYLSSTRESKTKIRKIENPERILDLSPVNFSYRIKKDGEYTEEAELRTESGFIYDEVIGIMPEICFEDTDDTPAGVSREDLIAPLVAMVQDLNARIEKLEGKK